MTTITLPAADLADALARCNHAMSTEETRPYLQGVHFRPAASAKRLIAEATDGHRLSKITLEALGDLPGFEPFIMSRATAAEVRKSIKRRHGVHPVSIDLDRRMIVLPEAEIALNTIDGCFPDCDRVIPDPKKHITLNREHFETCVAAVTGFANALTVRGRGANVLLTRKGETLTVSAQGMSAPKYPARNAAPTRAEGHAEMTMPIEKGATVPDGFAVGFQGRYLLDFLAQVGTPHPHVTLAIDGPDNPARLIAVGAERETYVMMPVRM
jgi:DNA polymerase-3 subunit beta